MQRNKLSYVAMCSGKKRSRLAGCDVQYLLSLKITLIRNVVFIKNDIIYLNSAMTESDSIICSMLA